ncbi:type II toxin-antitoxin system HipA family toxin [Candidatus Symbiobacter mobilis]|uniref:Serine/threonine-protein kinase HipA n=1 Tax=Candidatus Symbiobacter mobilis CR TaxID=946483 RepID=U5NDV6_9BURK|nr:type II toxin-antitoxin system HipA family toxin [Candidatus Symbiobacter mobilis]AGX88393.1 hypothetical protein Cenrod_2331 [Candidatus Symbiobacter mobilis CR]
MSAHHAIARTVLQTVVQVHLGTEGILVGQLTFVQQGRREFSQFAYAPTWLAHPHRFEISPDLPLQEGYQVHKAPTPDDSVFPFALADTAPDAWGRRVIDRAHAKARRANPQLAPPTAFDYLCAVEDSSRVGALRLFQDGQYLQTVQAGGRSTPPFIELERLYTATRAVETGRDTAEDLAYLQGKGTSLGGMRPKCTVLDEEGQLCIGKFPSVQDRISVPRAEVLALRLADLAGIRTAPARCVLLQGTPAALIRRFDRTAQQQRIPYLSAASMLQASRNEDRAYSELVDVMRQRCAAPADDVRELWRRLLFNLLITNTDDHLQNLGFLYDGAGHWRLAPAFDLNPMPGRLRESKTWLSEDTGPIDSVVLLIERCAHFDLRRDEALHTLAEVHGAVARWRQVGRSPDIGLTHAELDDLIEAFEHDQTRVAAALLHQG